eukprot:TRINITY_DN12582_c0_g1_i4.p1 TRINITY_DN12582_c0_g1~~TRINITY_DN12582_c0_g1_i4.p1  ORF type:complete len:934 (+),score=124.06 TRINITY_DN12582_c0_g1_i4:397-2802(+)
MAMQSSPYPPPSASPPTDQMRLSPTRPTGQCTAAPGVPDLSMPELVNFLRLHFSTDREAEAAEITGGAQGLQSLSDEDICSLSMCLQEELLKMKRAQQGLAQNDDVKVCMAAPSQAHSLIPSSVPSRAPSPAASAVQPPSATPTHYSPKHRRAQTPAHPDTLPQRTQTPAAVPEQSVSVDADWDAAVSECAKETRRPEVARSLIADGLWIGEEPALDDESLKADGIIHVVCADGQCKSAADSGGTAVKAHVVPHDKLASSLPDALAFIDAARSQGKAALVCDGSSGAGPAGAVVVAYLMHADPAMSLKDAATETLRRRQNISPSVYFEDVRRWQRDVESSAVCRSVSDAGSRSPARDPPASPPAGRANSIPQKALQAVAAHLRGRSRRREESQGSPPPAKPQKSSRRSVSEAGSVSEVTLVRASGERWGVDLTETPAGLLLSQAEPGSAADRAGLRRLHTWRITEVSGTPVTSRLEFQNLAKSSTAISLRLAPPPPQPKYERGDEVLVRDSGHAPWEKGTVVGFQQTEGGRRPLIKVEGASVGRAYTLICSAGTGGSSHVQAKGPTTPAAESVRRTPAPPPPEAPGVSQQPRSVKPHAPTAALRKTPVTASLSAPAAPPAAPLPTGPSQTPAGAGARKATRTPAPTTQGATGPTDALARLHDLLNHKPQRVVKFNATRGGCRYRCIAVRDRDLIVADEYPAAAVQRDAVRYPLRSLTEVVANADGRSFQKYHTTTDKSIRGFSKAEAYDRRDCFSLVFSGKKPLNFGMTDPQTCRHFLSFFTLQARLNATGSSSPFAASSP